MRQRTTLSQIAAGMVPGGTASWLAIVALCLPLSAPRPAIAATIECELAATGASPASWSLTAEYTGGDELEVVMPSGKWTFPVVHEAFPYVVGLSQSGIVTRLYAFDFQARTIGIVGVSAPIRFPPGSELPSSELKTFVERRECR